MSGVRCTPWDLHVPRETEIIFKKKADKGHGNFEEKVILARHPYIRVSDLEEHGMTRGCPKCDHLVKHQTWEPPTLQHLQNEDHCSVGQNSGRTDENCSSIRATGQNS